MNDRMYHEMKEILTNISGDIIDFRVYKGATFSYLVKLASEYQRHAIGMDTFYGLEEPCKVDWNEHNQLSYPKGYAKSTIDIVKANIDKVCAGNSSHELYQGNLNTILKDLPIRKYAIALIDLFQYNPTKSAIEYIYSKMTPGGVIYFLNYHKDYQYQSSKAVNEFLYEFASNITIYPDIFYNDNRLNICRVTCKPSEITILDKPITSIKKNIKNNKADVTIALVLKTGGDTYNYKYVNALSKNIHNNVNINFKLSVLTNDSTGFDTDLVDEVIPLKHNYNGWWSKIELFRPGIFTTNRVFYMDLDTVIVNNIDELLEYDSTFAGIRDLYHYNFLQTGILSWNPNYNNQVYNSFVSNSTNIMHNYIEGDAKWIRENVYNYDYLSDHFPGRIVSYKAHCLHKNNRTVSIPNNASIICFHGKPRPHTITNPLITKHWSYK